MTDNIDLILGPNNWTSVEISYEEIDLILRSIPRHPGIYNISTNAPKDILQALGARNDPKHYSFSDKINASDLLPEKFKILQIDNHPYIVYNGHQNNLRQRASEHFRGSQGTACLAIFELEQLRHFRWIFEYLDLHRIEDYHDNKVVRTYIEQAYRMRTGWPILCSQ